MRRRVTGAAISAIREMDGGEIFVPKIPSMKIIDLARAIGPDCAIEEIGIRPGEKINEVLITEDEAPRTTDKGGYYVIQHSAKERTNGHVEGGRTLPQDFRYSSEKNTEWLTNEGLTKIVEELCA